MEHPTPSSPDDDLAESEYKWSEVGRYLDYNWSRYRTYLYVASIIRFAVLAFVFSVVVALGRLWADLVGLSVLASLLYVAATLEMLAIQARRRQIDFYRHYTRG